MLSRKDFLNKFFLESSKKTRVVVSISTIGVVLFLVIASLFPFKDQLFNILYPKPVSKAAEPLIFNPFPVYQFPYLSQGYANALILTDNRTGYVGGDFKNYTGNEPYDLIKQGLVRFINGEV